jgi:hypothetical protein
MRATIIAGGIGSLLLLTGVTPGSAQSLSNVKGDVGAQLAGMACAGTVQDRTTANYHGAIRIAFATEGSALTGHLYGSLGDEVFQKAASPTLDLGDQGAVSELQVQSNQVSFKSIRGSLYQLTFNDGALDGVDVPTGHAPLDIKTHCSK